nr:MAG TPA: hypothetical protein [Caudoviricetes sp.]
MIFILLNVSCRLLVHTPYFRVRSCDVLTDLYHERKKILERRYTNLQIKLTFNRKGIGRNSN